MCGNLFVISNNFLYYNFIYLLKEVFTVNSYEDYLLNSLQEKIVGITSAHTYDGLFVNLSTAIGYLHSLAVHRFGDLHAAELRNLNSDD